MPAHQPPLFPSATSEGACAPRVFCTLPTLLLLAIAVLSTPVFAKPRPVSADNPEPSREELWVPADNVATVLKDYPRAVLLSREQYETLLRDARPKDPKLPAVPKDAALVSAQYSGKVEGKVLTVEATLTAHVLTGEWAQLPLQFTGMALAEIKVEGEGTLAPPPAPPKEKAQLEQRGPAAPKPPEELPTTLLLRGKGAHQITLRFTCPITTTDDAWRGVTFSLPTAGAASFTVDFPAHTLAESDLPLRTEVLPNATRVTVAVPTDAAEVHVGWRSSGGGLVALAPSVESKTAFTIDAETVQARSDLIIDTATGVLPETLDFILPAEARLVEVTGSDISGWTVEGQTAHLQLPPGRGSRVEFSTLVQRPTGLAQPAAEVPLPLPALAGAGRIAGEFSVYSGSGVAVRELSPTPGATPLPPAADVAGQWRFVGSNVAPKIRVERLRPRFHADLDTLLDFQTEAIFLERTITLHPEEGGVFNLLLTLPAGEEVITVRGVSGLKPDEEKRCREAGQELDPLWRVEAGRLLLRWLHEPAAGHPRTVQVKTRLEPKGWAAGVGRTVAALPPPGAEAPVAETFTYPVAEVKIEGAEKVSGYLALRASENFRLETTAAEMLEPRDGRTTPVTGAYAWFRRGEFDLKVQITRRPSERLAVLTGYALPLAGVLDLHAQIAWDFRYSGVRSVQVRVPEKQADLFHFEGPQIAERTLAGDTWTIVFQKELTGPQVISVTAQIKVAPAADDPTRFATAVPVIEPLHTQRSSGTWVIEANTDTEIQLTATGMSEVDALLAPPLAGYQPRHRVIGVFNWLGPTYALSLSGVRHASAAVLTTVVDALELNSLVGTTGAVRTEATLSVRTAGAQFLDVTLPASARLLSLLVDGEPSKPVEGRPGDVRVQLPATGDPTAATSLTLLYEHNATPEWKARGRSTLAPLRLPPEVPILKTTWHAFLPEGYYYSGATSNLTPAKPRWERPLVLAPLAWWDYRRAARYRDVWRASGLADLSGRGANSTNWALLNRWERLSSLSNGDGEMQARVRDALVDDAAPFSSFRAETEKLRQKLESTIIPKVEFREASLADALSFLEQKTGVRVLLKTHPIEVTIPGEEPAIPRVTIAVTAIPAEELLRYVTNLAGLKYRLVGDHVEVVNLGSSDVLMVREWRVPRDFLISTSGGGATSQRLEARDYLQAAGVTFPPGCSAIHLPGSAKLIVKNTEENLDLVDYIVAEAVPNKPGSSRHSRRQVEILTGPPKSDTARLQQKLRTIIIPRLEFRETSVREAIELLKQRSVELDTSEPDVSKRGVNIISRLEYSNLLEPSSKPPPSSSNIPGLVENPTSQPPALPNLDEARITIALTNIPLGEALRYVTNLAGLMFKVEPYAVSVVPLATPTDTLVTKEWTVAPGFISPAPTAAPGGGDATKGGSGIARRLEVRDYLQAAGIAFPPGASAIYLPGSNKLIVKSTQENLDLIDHIAAESGGEATPANLLIFGEEARKVGLLPMRLDLPRVGEEMVVTGLGAPEPLQVEYFALRERSRRLWSILLLGALGYFVLGGRHPWWRSAWVTLLLTAIPLCLWPGSTTICNLLLGGWLCGLVIGRLVRRFIFTPRAGQEALA